MKSHNKKIGSVVLAGAFFTGLFWMLLLYHSYIIFDIGMLKFSRPISSTFMRNWQLLHPFDRVKFNPVPSSQISQNLKNAVIAREDSKFLSHFGLDLEAIRKAAKVNWKLKKYKRGASTISQQLIKNLYLSPSKDLLRKSREAALAVLMDAYLSKDRILDIYLNIVEFAPGVFGAEAASQYYFKTSAKNLSYGQAAYLARVLPNPKRYGKRS